MVQESTLKRLVFAGMLTFGTCTVVIQKIIYNLKSTGKNGDKKLFKKPYYQTEIMFIGMAGCLIVYGVYNLIQYLINRYLNKGLTFEQLTKKPSEAIPMRTRVRNVFSVAIPALCDMCATAVQNVGLVWISASVWEMLRGSIVIFSAFFSKFFLKRRFHPYHWVGICIVAFSLLVVAFSAFMTPSETSAVDSSAVVESDGLVDEEATTTLQIIGCVLVVVSQIIQASQIVVEEFILRNVSFNPALVVGLEGLWGSICTFVLLFLITYIPSPYGEDIKDTATMIKNNPKIILADFFYACAILMYNMSAMFVTNYYSAVVRAILEGIRCACIWLTNLFIHYVVVPNDGRFGERWTDWSYLQLCGFVFLLEGMLVYNGFVKLSCIGYEDDDNAQHQEIPDGPEEDDMYGDVPLEGGGGDGDGIDGIVVGDGSNGDGGSTRKANESTPLKSKPSESSNLI